MHADEHRTGAADDLPELPLGPEGRGGETGEGGRIRSPSQTIEQVADKVKGMLRSDR